MVIGSLVIERYNMKIPTKMLSNSEFCDVISNLNVSKDKLDEIILYVNDLYHKANKILTPEIVEIVDGVLTKKYGYDYNLDKISNIIDENKELKLKIDELKIECSSLTSTQGRNSITYDEEIKLKDYELFKKQKIIETYELRHKTDRILIEELTGDISRLTEKLKTKWWHKFISK